MYNEKKLLFIMFFPFSGLFSGHEMMMILKIFMAEGLGVGGAPAGASRSRISAAVT